MWVGRKIARVSNKRFLSTSPFEEIHEILRSQILACPLSNRSFASVLLNALAPALRMALVACHISRDACWPRSSYFGSPKIFRERLQARACLIAKRRRAPRHHQTAGSASAKNNLSMPLYGKERHEEHLQALTFPLLFHDGFWPIHAGLVKCDPLPKGAKGCCCCWKPKLFEASPPPKSKPSPPRPLPPIAVSVSVSSSPPSSEDS